MSPQTTMSRNQKKIKINKNKNAKRPNGWILFSVHYCGINNSIKRKDAIKLASKEWKGMSNAQKRPWLLKALDEEDQFIIYGLSSKNNDDKIVEEMFRLYI